MKASYIAAGSLTVVLTLAAIDAGRTSLSYHWIPLLSVVALIVAVSSYPEARSLWRCQLAPALIWMGFVAIYVVNPTHRWEPGVGLLPASPWPFLPGSADSRHSLDVLGVSAAALSVFALACGVGRRRMRVLQWWAIAGGGIMAAVVLHQRLIPRRYPIFESTGTFPYENHYAAFANLLLPVVLMAGARFRFRAIQKGSASSPAGLCYLSALVIACSILMSGSRAAIVFMAFSLTGWLWVMWRLQRNYEFVTPSRTRARPFIWGSMILCAAVALVVVMSRVWNMFANWGREWQFRAQIVTDTLAVWGDNRWWGTGPGTFVSVFPYYKSEALQRHHVAHTHCEPLQFLAEYGVLGFLLTACVGVWLWLCARRQPSRPNTDWPTFNEVEGPGFLLALGTLTAHSLVDFPFRMPVIVLVVAIWLGLLAAHGERPSSIPERGRPRDSIDNRQGA